MRHVLSAAGLLLRGIAIVGASEERSVSKGDPTSVTLGGSLTALGSEYL